MLPAAGQGALGIEIRADRADLITALAPLAHPETWRSVSAERAVSRAMGGSCSMPLAAFATLEQGAIHLKAAWGDPEGGATLLTAHGTAPAGDLTGAAALGEQVAAQLRAQGAR